MKIFLQNFGCKVNAIETDSLAALMTSDGWSITADAAQADAIVLNSCTVTASGDHRMKTALRRLRRLNPRAAIVLTGCYVQAFPEEAAALPEADLLIGTKERGRLPALLASFLQQHNRLCSVHPYGKTDAFEILPVGTDPAHTRAFLKIQDGCNRFCTYCIIPYARGRCRSLPAAVLTAQARELAGRGYREIVLCGINLACYDADGLDIADAVRLCRDAGFPRVRLGSLEPDFLTDAVLGKLSACPAFCPQFHISLQSGCDRTLQAMGRHYASDDYRLLLQRIRQLFPDAAVTTDIMVGFPGETEADFAQSLAFAEEMAFSSMHIFRYSRRPGTPADRRPDQIPEHVKKLRADRLSEIAGNLRAAHLRTRIGCMEEVLFEREKQPYFHNGHTRSGLTVRVPKEADAPSLRGEIRNVQITAAEAEGLAGLLL